MQLRWYLLGTALLTLYLLSVSVPALLVWVVSALVAWWQSKKSTDGGDGWVQSAGIVFVILVSMVYFGPLLR